MFKQAERPVYLEVDLDAINHNTGILRQLMNKDARMIAVVKTGAYSHGSVYVSHHLKSIGVERLAVATVNEAMHLRKYDVFGPIHVFGNVQAWEMASCVKYNLIPSVSSAEAIQGMAHALNDVLSSQVHQEKDIMLNGHPKDTINGKGTRHTQDPPIGSVHIKVDTGLSRNGCQPHELPALIRLCDQLPVTCEGVFTHFADPWNDKELTKLQLDLFLECIAPYRASSITFHVSASGSMLLQSAPDLDFVRPGIALFGLTPDVSDELYHSFDLHPVACIKAIPTRITCLPPKTSIGYGCTYKTSKHEWVATLPLGYGDGYWRHLSSNGFVVRDKTGEKCPVVGRVSTDAITVIVSERPEKNEIFTIMSADFDSDTSALGIASRVGTIPSEVLTRLTTRLPKVYKSGEKHFVVEALAPDSY